MERFGQGLHLVGSGTFSWQEERTRGHLRLQENEAALFAGDFGTFFEIAQVLDVGLDQRPASGLAVLTGLDDALQLPDGVGELRGVWMFDGQWDFLGCVTRGV